MSALEIEKNENVQAEDAVVIVDCGSASERTKGLVVGYAIELGSSPNNWFF